MVMINIQKANELTRNYIEKNYKIDEDIIDDVWKQIETTAKNGINCLVYKFYRVPDFDKINENRIIQFLYVLSSQGFNVENKGINDNDPKGFTSYNAMEIKWNPFEIVNNVKCPDCKASLKLLFVKHNS